MTATLLKTALALPSEAARVVLFTIHALKDELTDQRSRHHRQWGRTEVAHFEHLLTVDPRPHERCTDVHHQPKARKATAALKPTAKAWPEPDPFTGDPQHRLPRHDQDVPALGDLQLVGAFAVVGVIANLDHFMHLAEHPKRGAEGEVYGCRPNMVGVEGRDRDQAVVNCLKNGLPSKHRHR